MRFVALATDYDGTLATDGRVEQATIDALERLKASDRRLILVSGRELEDLRRVFPQLDLFEWVVAENGALAHHPRTREDRLLGARPPPEFVAALRERGVEPLSVGHVIVATWEPNEVAVLDTIREQGLELEIVFNKGAVMVLPSGVNKAAGLRAVLEAMALSPHNVVGIGDAENDLAFLGECECGVAVANALPSVKEACDHVTEGDHGTGVRELVELLLEDDLRSLEPKLTRHHVLLGRVRDGEGAEEGERDLLVPSARVSVLVAGPSASGKSTLTTGLLERLQDQGRQLCVVDPEGDYQAYRGAIVLGDADRVPGLEEVLSVLARPDESVVVNLLGLALDDRPAFFDSLVARLQDLRGQTGRPHWVIVDEAHHLLPVTRGPAVPSRLGATLLVTVHPDQVAGDVLQETDLVVAVGADADATVEAFARAAGVEGPARCPAPTAGRALAWWPRGDGSCVTFDVVPPRERMKRHRLKYVEGELGPDRSFYFRGPDGRLALRAQNLLLFTQLAEGVDDETWTYHLRRGDVSAWFRGVLKDEELASEAERVERDDGIDPTESRRRIRAAIDARYTL